MWKLNTDYSVYELRKAHINFKMSVLIEIKKVTGLCI